MLGPKQEAQAALFYELSLENHVPQDHLLRSIDPLPRPGRQARRQMPRIEADVPGMSIKSKMVPECRLPLHHA